MTRTDIAKPNPGDLADMEIGARVHAMEPFGLRIEAPDGSMAVSELPAGRLRRWTREHGVVVLRGFLPFGGGDELAAYAAGLGEIMMWPFGPVLDIFEKEHSPDAVFDHTCLPLHWDGMYVELIPEFFLLHCVSAPPPGAGGETVFCDTARVWDHAPEATRAAWRRVRITYDLLQITHYGGRVTSPLVTEHPRTGRAVLRFNEPMTEDMGIGNRHAMEVDGVAPGEQPAFFAHLGAALRDPRHYYEHVWRPGDVVIADNYTLLHGRNAFTSRAPRHLRRVHILGTPPLRNPALPGREPGR